MGRIETADGDLLYERAGQGQQVIGAQVAHAVTDILTSQIETGDATAATLSGGHQAAGQPGVTEANENAWFVDYSNYFTTAIWIGDPNERRLITVAGTPRGDCHVRPLSPSVDDTSRRLKEISGGHRRP